MAGPRHARRLLRRAAATLVAFAIVGTVAPLAEAHTGVWQHSYRKWPWKAGENRQLTTLPGECPHCPGVQSSSAWKAIDASLRYENVYSIAGGNVDAYVTSGGGAGKYLRIKDDDGSYVTYEHLSKSLVSEGDEIVAGQPIAVSGCTGNCSGPHLHFQRQEGRSFNSDALTLIPISGHWRYELTHGSWFSDNGGVAHTADDKQLQSMRDTYLGSGGYDNWGITDNIGEGWTPCRSDAIAGTWFRYWCEPRPGISGTVQTYIWSGHTRRALMRPSGYPKTYKLLSGILAAYTEKYFGEDWVYWLGYPVGNRSKKKDGSFRQSFQHGYIKFLDDPCTEEMWVQGSLWKTYHFCD